ncbi:baseplate J/gp47 family protein [Fodinicurvata fenggangensis]|uniref:baseplate J/gp47 family protein n=1 Tax=Fodinicurvata fenggangensis TaxID=1121830 RepID=UPI00047A9B9A|nr:baseplate J/gp47 family protein [Fodinicurvata fenggangensis]
MPETGFDRPGLTDLIEQVRADILARSGQDETLRRSDLEVQARVQAGGLHGLYGYLDWLARQMLPDTAEAEILDRHASWWGVARKGATRAEGRASFSTNAGAEILEGTVLQREGSDFDFVTTESATATGSETEVAIEAEEAGPDGNLPEGAVLSLVSSIPGVGATATVIELTGGADVESDSDLRGRLHDRIRRPPAGGAKHDYVAWALEQPGVTRAWCYPLQLGVGTVGVTFVMDEREDIIPTPADVDAVQSALDLLRPVTGDLTVYAPQPEEVELTIQVNPDTPEVRAAIEEAVRDFIFREAEPGGTLYLSRLREAISLAAGERRHDLINPAADISVDEQHISIFGTITWESP